MALDPIADELLRAHYCLESVDRVPGDTETTAFKRWARLHQALWRESRGLEIGTQPMRPRPDGPSRPLGSRIELGVAQRTGANFLSDGVRQSVARRLATKQPYQTLNADRLYCDLLSSMPMCFNLFAELQADLGLADRAVHTWWPETPGTVTHVCFEWSPGRRVRGEYLENSSAFDVAFLLDLPSGERGVLGVETKYHEDCRKEERPSSERLERYGWVTAASGTMTLDCVEQIIGTDLQQIWLDHLLAVSMPLNRVHPWGWAGFALVHPAGNPSYARATERHRALLATPASLHVNTIESLIEADVLPDAAATAFAERYL
jgi:hypothetical protein